MESSSKHKGRFSDQTTPQMQEQHKVKLKTCVYK